MKISIINERENPFLKRKEIYIEINHSDKSTPAKAALQALLSKEFKKEVEHIDIRNIFSDYGKAKSKAKVFLWEEKKAKDLSKVKKEKKEVKPEAKEEKKVEEKPKEEKKEKEEAKPTKEEAKPKEEEKEKVKLEPSSPPEEKKGEERRS